MIVAAALLSSAAPAPPAPPSPDAGETIVYVVRKGDTLYRLTRSFVVPPRTWRSLLGLARIRDPRQLPIGRRIAVPRAWLRYAPEPARLASYRGTVRLMANGRAVTPAVGALVGEGAEIATAANSFVTLVLADRSKIVLPSQSRVRVRQLRRVLLTGTIDYRIEVQSGRLETKVTPLDGPDARYRIQTPVSMTAVRGTEFRVAYAPERNLAATEVLEGVVSITGTGGMAEGATLHPSNGATVDRGGVVRTEKLLPAPDLDDPGRIQTRDAVEFRANPVAGATGYRAVIAADAGFVENLAEQLSGDGRFAFADIPNGRQFVRIWAIAPSGIEGMAQSYGFTRRLASIHGAVEAGDDGYRFRWFGAGSGTRRYHFQLMRGSPDARPMVDQVGLSSDTITLGNLPADVYYWRVGLLQVENGESVESWTDPEKLTIAAPSGRGGRP